MKRIDSGEHRIETPVGTVGAPVHRDRAVTVNNVASYRLAVSVEVQVPVYGKLHGEVAWGGNWFFLVRDSSLEPSLEKIKQLTDCTGAIRKALCEPGTTETRNQKIDHIALFGQSDPPRSTTRTSCFVPGRPTIVPPAALGPAPSGQASMPMEKSAKDRFGSKRVLSGVGLKAALRRAAAKSTPASRRQPS